MTAELPAGVIVLPASDPYGRPWDLAMLRSSSMHAVRSRLPFCSALINMLIASIERAGASRTDTSTPAPAVQTPVPRAVTVAAGEHSAATVTRTDDRCICGHAKAEHKGGDQYCNGWTELVCDCACTTPCGCAWFVLGGGAA